VIGTHTHVQTADEQIFPGGTAFLCDAGMCGPINSILGRSIDPIVSRFISNMPAPFPVAAGEVRLRGALIEIDEISGCAVRIQRVDEAGPAQAVALEPEARIDLEASTAPEEA
jgi:calcineurin-like phosphoesterase